VLDTYIGHLGVEITPVDGERYVRALPYTFNGQSFHAELFER